MPLDPIELAHGISPKNTPNFIDENPNLESFNEGLEVSESERRDAADDEFGLDPSLPLSDGIGENEDVAPEIAAIHEVHVADL